MLQAWPHYQALMQQSLPVPAFVMDLPAPAPAEWLSPEAPARLVSLGQLHYGDRCSAFETAPKQGLWVFPAYGKVEYCYEGHRITRVEAETYHHIPVMQRINQFDAMGAAYAPEYTDIVMEYRLAAITSRAALYAMQEEGFLRADGEPTSGALMVIDGLRTVDGTFALAAANPFALENKLLALPGKSAHNKGMAVDLTLIYEDGNGQWCDADMLGHIDHPDMTTNHRNFGGLSELQQHNRLYLEHIMLRAALSHCLLLAPLREEFWDFRFPQDALDLWRVLEAIARVIQHTAALQHCSEQIEHINLLLRAGNKDEAYQRYALDKAGFAAACLKIFGADDARHSLLSTLNITPEKLAALGRVYHGDVGVVFDANLPAGRRQVHPDLQHVFAVAG